MLVWFSKAETKLGLLAYVTRLRPGQLDLIIRLDRSMDWHMFLVLGQTFVSNLKNLWINGQQDARAKVLLK